MTVVIHEVKITLHFSFILFLATCMLTGEMTVLFVIAFASAHEAGHIMALYLLGGKADSIDITFLGIGMKHSTRLSYSKELIFLLSGIAVNSIFCISGFFTDINGALMLVNALPVYPLDGGRALKIALNRVMGLGLSDRIFQTISTVVIVLLFAYALYTINICLIAITVYVTAFSICNSFD